MVMSSAYVVRCTSGGGLGMSAIYMLNSVGDSTPPCGTPDLNCFLNESMSWYLFLCILKFNNFRLCGWILLILVSFFCITLAFDIIIFLVSISSPDSPEAYSRRSHSKNFFRRIHPPEDGC